MEPAIFEELDRLRSKLSDLTASGLTTADGLAPAHDLHGIERDGVAALSAAHSALADGPRTWSTT